MFESTVCLIGTTSGWLTERWSPNVVQRTKSNFCLGARWYIYPKCEKFDAIKNRFLKDRYPKDTLHMYKAFSQKLCEVLL